MTPEQKRYVAGFLFTHDLRLVAMIRKARPSWQCGRLNAIGGKIEPGETNEHAMGREFNEEAELLYKDFTLQTDDWYRYTMLEFPDSIIHFYTSRLPKLTHDPEIRAKGDEPVEWVLTENLLHGPWLMRTMRNIPEMLNLALHYYDFCDTGIHK